MTRRMFFVGAASLGLGACADMPRVSPYSGRLGDPYGRDPYWQDPYGRDPYGRDRYRRDDAMAGNDASYSLIYGERQDDGYTIPAVDLSKVDPQFLRREVRYDTPEMVGTVIVDTSTRYLYLVREGGTAIRYGVGIGKQGFSWSGRARIQWKQEWPKWTPPDEMIARKPELAEYSADNGGMAPGLNNPLGARALYIFQNGVDTLYRVHGTPEYWTIGKAVSSGCVRMMNQDVIDLYDRVPSGSPIIVM